MLTNGVLVDDGNLSKLKRRTSVSLISSDSELSVVVRPSQVTRTTLCIRLAMNVALIWIITRKLRKFFDLTLSSGSNNVKGKDKPRTTVD